MVQLAAFLLLSICSFSYAAPVQENSPQDLSARADAAHHAGAAAAKPAAAHTEGPTAAEIVASKTVTEAFQKAWDDSFNTPTTAQEIGGWIYADKNKPNHAFWIRRAHKDNSKPMNQHKPAEGVRAGIDLNDPDRNPGGNPPGPPADYYLVATFHTHPMGEAYGGNAKMPSKADLENAWERAVPGIVINREGLVGYGPERRFTMTGPQGYPKSQGEKYSGGGNGKRVGTWRPTAAKNQKD